MPLELSNSKCMLDYYRKNLNDINLPYCCNIKKSQPGNLSIKLKCIPGRQTWY